MIADYSTKGLPPFWKLVKGLTARRPVRSLLDFLFLLPFSPLFSDDHEK